MFWTIYQLQKDGNKLPAEDVRQGAVVAGFVFERHPVHPTIRASMVDPANGKRGRWIDTAHIVKVDGGVLVSGYEPMVTGSRQTWWCVPLTTEPVAAKPPSPVAVVR